MGHDDEIEVLQSNRAALAKDDPELRAKQFKAFEDAARRAILAGTPRNTYRSYMSGLKDFQEWCELQVPPITVIPAPPAALQGYLDARDVKDQVGQYPCKATTLEHRLAAVVWAHALMNHPSPVTPRVARHMQAIKRRRLESGEEVPPKKAAPLLVADLRQIAQWGSECGTPVAIRNVALVVLGWSCALRRSEISSLDYSDVTQLDDKGFMLNIRRGKTDQLSKGVQLPVTAEEHDPEICPVTHLKHWLDIRGRASGPLFWRARWERDGAQRISGKGVGGIIERVARQAGLKTEDRSLEFSGHSLRAGFITDAVREGLPHPDIMNRSRHKTYEVFLGYVRVVQTVEKNVATGFGRWGKKTK